MTIDVVEEDARWAALGLEDLANRAFAATMDHLNLRGFEAALLATDDARIAVLNTEFRDKAKPTNVLSWPSEERGADIPGGAPRAPTDPELGDIALAYDTCAAEADAAGLPMTDHVTHLTIHAVLHLLGYDHETEPDAALMEGLEREILGKLGLHDPY